MIRLKVCKDGTIDFRNEKFIPITEAREVCVSYGITLPEDADNARCFVYGYDGINTNKEIFYENRNGEIVCIDLATVHIQTYQSCPYYQRESNPHPTAPLLRVPQELIALCTMTFNSVTNENAYGNILYRLDSQKKYNYYYILHPDDIYTLKDKIVQTIHILSYFAKDTKNELEYLLMPYIDSRVLAYGFVIYEDEPSMDIKLLIS